MSGSALLDVAVVAVAGLAGWLLVSASRAVRQRMIIRRRMSQLSVLFAPEEEEERASLPVREEQTVQDWWLVTFLNARYPLAGGVRTGVIAVGVGVLCFIVMTAALRLFGLGGVLGYVVSIMAGGGLAWYLGTMLEDAKRSDFSVRFLVILEDMQRMVRYGISSHQALASAAAAAAEPVKASLNNILLETDFGVSIGAAMEREARRTRITELMMLAAVFSTQSFAGGTISESVDNLAKSLRARQDNRTRMDAATAESRITMIILSLVPVAAIGLQAVLQPELVDDLLGEGRQLLGIGVGFILAGLLASWVMIRRAKQ